MATTNPFDLLGDDDPSLQLTAQQQKLAAVSAATKKSVPSAAGQGPKLVKLPTKPLPPSQAVKEARNEAGSSWQPREEGLMEICGLLEHQISKTSTTDKSQILHQQQRHYSQFPDFDNYLVFILSRAEGKALEIRQAAGLLLKNNLKNAFKNISPANQHYIKLELLHCLGSPDWEIWSTTGTIISVIVQLGGVVGWPELLHALGTCLDSNDLNQMEGAMDALSKDTA